MDLAHPNQILLTDFAYQKIKNDFLVGRNDYCAHLFDKGKIAIKNHIELENLYSLYKENEYGNNTDIEIRLDIKPLFQSYKVDKSFVNPLQSFCEEWFKIIIKKFKEITNPSKGLEMSFISSGLLYKVLFENASEYISVTYLTPSEYWEIQNSESVNLLRNHKKSLRKINLSRLNKKRYRFIIKEKEKLNKDIYINQDSSLLFIKWHSENNVNLFNINPEYIDNILSKYSKIVHNVGIGLWYDKYVLQFGPIMEYTSDKDQYHPLKRRFWLHPVESDTYTQSLQFFDDLIKAAEERKFIRIDHNFYNKIIKS